MCRHKCADTFCSNSINPTTTTTTNFHQCIECKSTWPHRISMSSHPMCNAVIAPPRARSSTAPCRQRRAGARNIRTSHCVRFFAVRRRTRTPTQTQVEYNLTGMPFACHKRLPAPPMYSTVMCVGVCACGISRSLSYIPRTRAE